MSEFNYPKVFCKEHPEQEAVGFRPTGGYADIAVCEQCAQGGGLTSVGREGEWMPYYVKQEGTQD